MPTYKEALKKLKRKKSTTKKKTRPRKIVKKRKPVKKAKPRQRLKPIKKKRVKKKTKPRKKAIKRIKPKRKVVKKRKPVKKVKPRKSRPRSGSRQRSGKKIIKRRKPVKKRKVIRKKPTKKRKVIRKKPVKKRKPRRKKPTKPRVYIGKGTLDQLFESQAKVKLLRLFFRNAEEIFQTKEVFKRLRSNMALLRQEMKKLEKLGLIRQRKAWLSFEKKRGGIRKERKTVWHLNPNFDFLNELRDLVLKSSIASKGELVEKARRIGNIKLLVLAGVFIGDDTAKADLLIVGDRINHRKLNSFIKDLEAEVGKEVNCAVMTSREFDYRYDMYDRFVRDLLDNKSEILIKKLELW